MKILFVENHALFADQVRRQFLSIHKVEVVSSLAAARLALQMENYDLLIVDYDLDDAAAVHSGTGEDASQANH